LAYWQFYENTTVEQKVCKWRSKRRKKEERIISKATFMLLIRQQKWNFLNIMRRPTYLFFYRYFRWFDLNLAYASGYRSFETWLVNGWFKVDLLSDVKDFCQLLVTITWIAFFQHRFNQLCRLLAAVKMFTKRYMMIYFLLLHNFQTTSVNARWGQPFSSNLKAFQNKPQVECFCMLCSCG